MEFFAELTYQNKLNPAYNSDYDILAKVKKNKVLKWQAIEERNPKFHRKVMALFNLAHQNQEKWEDFNMYRRYLTIKAGYFNQETTDKGLYVEAKSISFANMPQDEFEQLFNKLLDVISKELSTKPEIIRNQVNDFL